VRSRQRGTGLVGSLAGVTMFLAFLLLAVQVLFGLAATTTVTANGFDAARDVAAYQRRHDAVPPPRPELAQAEADARRRLGAYSARVRFDWSGTDADTVHLHLTADAPRLLLFGHRALGSSHLDRVIVLRVERFR